MIRLPAHIAINLPAHIGTLLELRMTTLGIRDPAVYLSRVIVDEYRRNHLRRNLAIRIRLDGVIDGVRPEFVQAAASDRWPYVVKELVSGTSRPLVVCLEAERPFIVQSYDGFRKVQRGFEVMHHYVSYHESTEHAAAEGGGEPGTRVPPILSPEEEE